MHQCCVCSVVHSWVQATCQHGEGTPCTDLRMHRARKYEGRVVCARQTTANIITNVVALVQNILILLLSKRHTERMVRVHV